MLSFKEVIHSIQRNLKLLLRYSILSFKDITEYKFTFFSAMFFVIIGTLTNFLTWKVMLGNQTNFLGWTLPELLILSFATGIYISIVECLLGFLYLEEYILEGILDLILVRPINSFYHIILKGINMFLLLRMFLAEIPMLIFISIYFKLNLNWLNILGFIFFLTISSILVILILSIFFMSAFWLGRNEFIYSIHSAFENYINKPLDLFPNVIKILFTFIYPLIFVSVIPTKVLLGKLSFTQLSSYLGIIIILFIIWGFIAYKVWNKGLKRYESGSG